MNKHKIKGIILIKFLVLSYHLQLNGQDIQNLDTQVKVNKYTNNINTHLYISKKNNSNPYFLDEALKYSDSILSLDSKNQYALTIQSEIETTKSTIKNNVINKFQLFDFFVKIPKYYGFVDDPIEYAYDDALKYLLETKYIELHNEPLSKSNIISILIRKNCDDEMVEIINQILINNTNHHVVQQNQLSQVFDQNEIVSFLNGGLEEDKLLRILDYFKIDRVGIFTVDNLDVIDDKIWFVQTDFNLYERGRGFTDKIYTRGFNIDKRSYSYFWLIKFILTFILSTLILMVILNFIISYVKNIFSKRKIKNHRKLNEILGGFKKHLTYISLPLFLSILMIFLCSYIAPGGDEHYLEINVLFWVLTLTFSVSFLPIIINLFVINRLNIDGFHTIKGYTQFVSSSLLPTYLPFFIFFSLKYEINFLDEILILLSLSIITYLIGQVLGESFFEITSNKRNESNKTLPVIGTILGFITLFFINQLIIFEFSIKNLTDGIIISFTSTIIFILLKKYYSKDLNFGESKNIRTINLENHVFVDSVIDIQNKVYKPIIEQVENDLKIYLIHGPQGIGKTTCLNEVKLKFINEGWNWFYGDCDEIQSETSVMFEPFLEAFSDLLDNKDFIDRTSKIDRITRNIISTTLDSTIGINPFSEIKVDSSSSINNMCLEIIEKLETVKGNIILVMEDIHWIDSDTFSFLKHFIKTINRNFVLRKRFNLILTLRNNIVEGVSLDELLNELNELNLNTENNISIQSLLTQDDFEIKDFLLGVNDKTLYKIASDSLDEINEMFNSMMKENKELNKIVTPLYIKKTIDFTIDNNILKESPEGYVLVKSLNPDIFPNIDEVDLFYHKIFDEFDKKWIRLLESATIVGSKFDADIISQLWGYNLLEVLTFLEESVKKGILTDLSQEDNFYEFKDKRIISAVRSYFKDDLIQFRGEKQIIIEYNKRYLDLVSDQLYNPELYFIDDNLKLIRRLISLRFIERYFERLNHLILDVTLRYLYNYQHEKLNVFGKYLKKNNLEDIGDLIIDLSIVVNHFESTDEKKFSIVEKIKNDHLITNDIPIESNYTRNLLNDLRLLILLNSTGSWSGSKRNLVEVKSLGFEYLDFSTEDWIYLTNDFTNKLKGISKLQYIKEYLKDLLSSSCLITNFEYDLSIKEERNKLEILFREIKEELKGSHFEYIINTEYELFRLNFEDGSTLSNEEKFNINNLNLPPEDFIEGEDLEVLDDINSTTSNKSHQNYLMEKLNRYKKLINEIIQFEDQVLVLKSLNDLLNFTNYELKSYQESKDIYEKYIKFLLNDETPSELWVIWNLNFFNSTSCTCRRKEFQNVCSCIKTGEKYISEHKDEVEIKLKLINEYLYKIIESNTLSSISNLLFEVQRLFLIKTNQYNNLLILIDNQKLKFVKTYKIKSWEYEKFLNNNSILLKNLEFYEKSIEYLQENIKIIEKKDVISKYILSQKYFELSICFKKLKNYEEAIINLKSSFEYILDYLERKSPDGWELMNNKLIPLSNDKNLLFLSKKKTNTIKIKPVIDFYGRIFQEFGYLNYKLKKFEISNKYYEESMEYVDKDFSYTRYYIVNLLKGINLREIDIKMGTKIINNSIDKLNEKLVPDHDLIEYKKFKNEINKIIDLI